MSRARRFGGAAAVLLWVLCGQGCRRKAELAAPAPAPTSGTGPKTAVEDLDTTTRTRRAAGARAPVIWLGLDGLDWELLERLGAGGREADPQGHTRHTDSARPH